MDSNVFWIWKKNNALLYPTNSVETQIENVDQRIASVAVTATRKQVTVLLSEYKPTYRYCLQRLSRADGGVLRLPTEALQNESNFASSSTEASSTASSVSSSTVVTFVSSSTAALQLNSGEELSVGLLELPSPELVGVDTHDCYWVDDRGYIFAKSPQYSGSPLLTIIENDPSRNETLVGTSPIGSFVFEKNEFTHLVEVVDQLHLTQFSLRRLVRMSSGDVILDIGYPWNLAMNIKAEPKDALTHFFLALRELGDVATGDKSQLKVIDVRFGNKVFYR